MKKLNYLEIANDISQGKINFVAYVMTPWHLIGAKAACRYVKDLGIDIKPIAISLPHQETGFSVLSDDEIPICFIGTDKSSFNYLYYILFLLRSFFLRKQDQTPDCFMVMPWFGHFKSIFRILPSIRKDFKVLIFEEGTGSYEKRFYDWRYYFKNKSFLNFVQVFIDMKLSDHFQRVNRLIYLNPFEYQKDGSLAMNRLAVSYYKKALRIDSIELNEKRVVILLQDMNDYFYKLINKVIKVLREKDFVVYIKGHPRFPLNMSEFGEDVNVVTSSIAAEYILQEIRAKYVVGFDTTALVSLRYLYDAIPISLIFFVDRDKYNRVDLYYWLYETFPNILSFPKSFDELESIMSLK